jgi:hypothetical protein
LDYVIKNWVEHYNTMLPHQGLDKRNNMLGVDFKPQVVGEVNCREKLGGSFKSITGMRCKIWKAKESLTDKISQVSGLRLSCKIWTMD